MDQKNKIPMHFAHANGFPIGSYHQIFKQFSNEFEVQGKTKFAHDDAYPVNANLTNLVQELIAYLQDTVGKPVYLVGHSMGGVISFITACERPDLVKGLIMLDPPIASGLPRLAFKLLKRTRLIDKYTPAGKTASRCQSWPLDTDLVAYFRARALFRDFKTACIEDYVAAAINEREGRLELNYDPQIEASIYRNVPHNLNRYYTKLKVPSLLLTGSNSDVCTPAFLKSFIKKSNIEQQLVKGGGHMFPMEKPEEVAEIIATTLQGWERSAK
jgi:pimeloyl-ACP methyl ester carboxylesterase